jgi:predicted component of type VI protein secretion system
VEAEEAIATHMLALLNTRIVEAQGILRLRADKWYQKDFYKNKTNF